MSAPPVSRGIRPASASSGAGREGGMPVIAATLGVFVGVSGLDHGLFETMQGNVRTTGLVVQAIGPQQRMWIYGTEEALTIVPNFLLTGILAMIVGLLVIAWSIGFLDRPNGPRTLLGLGLLLLLVGGGIAMVVFLVLAVVVARRIHRPITWWRVLPAPVTGALASAWPALLGGVGVLYAVALEIAIVGYVPGLADPDLIRSICWLALLAMLPLLLMAVVGASARASSAGRS